MQLIEFVEMYRILGVSHFFIYTSTLVEPQLCVLDQYKEEGIVTTLRWNTTHTVSGDCIYRAMNKFQYVGTVKITEFIFPRNDSHTLPDLLS